MEKRPNFYFLPKQLCLLEMNGMYIAYPAMPLPANLVIKYIKIHQMFKNTFIEAKRAKTLAESLDEFDLCRPMIK